MSAETIVEGGLTTKKRKTDGDLATDKDEKSKTDEKIYLMQFLFNSACSSHLIQTYFVDEEIYNKLRGFDKGMEFACCGQSQCIGCALTIQHAKHIDTMEIQEHEYQKNKTIFDFLATNLIDIDILLSRVHSDDDETEEEYEQD